MTWLQHHRQSEQLASDAEAARRNGENDWAQELYSNAAKAEELALQDVEPDKARTYGITAVSAVSLYFKSAQWDLAQLLAYCCLGSGRLPSFAPPQLEDLLNSIRTEKAGISIADGQILVSIRGGEVLAGGAPMDLIIARADKIKSMLYRTTEHLKGIPHRRQGEPSREMQDSFRPWMFQSAPGSYQFAVGLQSSRQLNMFYPDSVRPKQVVDGLFGILQACAESPGSGLPELVPDDNYRSTFLKLTRDLAPTGKRFARLEIRSADVDRPVVLNPAIRDDINDVIREIRPHSPPGVETEVRGVLRAVHLDKDWIEIAADRKNVRIDRVREEVDDRIGPMVNHPVVVRASRVKKRLHFRDIEADE